MSAGRSEAPERAKRKRSLNGTMLTVAALGVVFGDIGTSPLYALTSVFQVKNVHPDHEGVYGMISLVVWVIVLVVSLKYVVFVMRADNRGEGGIMALVALVQDLRVTARRQSIVLTITGIAGVALFFGDGTITPAISVISSVEGLEVALPSVHSLVVPITVALLTLLFFYQQLGTEKIASMFGPIMLGWFVLIAVTGAGKVVAHPDILKALLPTYGVRFFVDHPGTGFLSLGAVVLVVTGAEALYADMGQFDRRSITRAWFFIVFPSLIIQYLGQGALILQDPRQAANAFFGLLPHWAQVPMVVVAVIATMIASQAVITGAFSVARQAVRLGFLPRLRIVHKSRAEGQIYVPAVNWLLFIAVIGLVIGFGSDTALGSAYGIAVTGTFTTTTLLYFAIVRLKWHMRRRLVVLGMVVFLTIDLLLFTSNLTKVPTGGWFPLLIGVILFIILTTWQSGRSIVSQKRRAAEGSLSDFVHRLETMKPPPYRSPGVAVALSSGREGTPLALRDNLRYDHVLHEHVVIVHVETRLTPHVDADKQITIEDLDYTGDDIVYVTINYGFQDRPDVPRALRRAAQAGLLGELAEIDMAEAVYLVSEITLVASDHPSLGRLRTRLFLLLAKTARSPVDSFHLPRHRIVTMGTYIEI